jgi:RHS repeat-associated protein
MPLRPRSVKGARKSWAWGLWAALLALVVPFVVGGPVYARTASAPHYDVTPAKEHPVAVEPVPVKHLPTPRMPSWDPSKAHRAWPVAGSADLTVAPAAAKPTTGATPSAVGPPVRVTQATGPEKQAKTTAAAGRTATVLPPAPVTRVHLTVESQQFAQRLHLSGVVLAVGRSDGAKGTANTKVTLDYTAFRDAYGADWGTRLRLVSLPACALITPGSAACRRQTPVASTNDNGMHMVSAVVPLSGDTHAPPVVLAATAAASGGGGTFAATSLAPSGQWSAGGSTGAFTWAYPVTVPQVPGGLQPSVSLDYNSQTVDGRTSATSPQASWVGDGWDYSPGYIEETYAKCSDDTAGGGPKTGDACWSDATDTVTLSLNGASNTLVHDDKTGTWHPQGDSGETVKVATDTVNPDKEHRYFTVTAQDGTTYWFGRNELPGWSDHGTTGTSDDDPVTNSVWTARVYGNDTGEPCHASTFAASACAQAYRWNLDYVTDDHGNAVSYWYGQETGYYGADNSTTPAAYTRGGYLKEIQYGQRAGKVYDTAGTPAAARVWFDVTERCLPDSAFDCAAAKLTSANASHWPDVPYDQICPSTGTCNNHGAAYFTTKWLSGIRTEVLVSGAYQKVDAWKLDHTFPAPTDPKDTTTPAAWLSAITRTGQDGGAAALAPITFGGQSMINRVDGLDGYQPLSRYRISTITTESDEVIQVLYTTPQCHRLNTTVLPSSPDTDTMRCYPAYWTPPGQVNPALDWFNKYLVSSVTEQDPTGGGLPKETHYSYLGDAAWHFADDAATPAKYRTWNEWRGYGQVETRAGTIPGSGVVTLSRATYFRGMDGDKTSTGTRSVSLTDTAKDDSVADKDEYAGQVFEVENFNGDGGARLSDAVIDPWDSAATATQDRSKAGLSPLTAHMTSNARQRVTTTKADGTPRTVETDYIYDGATGLPTAVDDLGDTATAADDRCDRTWYARDGSGATLPVPRRTQSVSVACTATPTYPGDLVADDEIFYDGATDNSAPVTGPGDVTTVKKADSVAADGTAHYLTVTTHLTTTGTSAYDIYGRALSETDPLGRTTTTQYTPATGAAPVSIKITEPRVTGQLQGFSSTTALDPARGLPLSSSDAAGYVTSHTYDPLGRVTATWEPGFSQSLGVQPNEKYSYNLSRSGPSTVTTQALVDNGSATAYQTSVSIYDALLRPRETQTATVDGGRVISDTAYDEHGWTVKVNGPYYANGSPSGALVYAPDNQVATETGTFYDGAGRVTASAAYYKASETWRTTTAYPGSDRTDVTPPQGGTATSTITDGRSQTVQLLTYHGTTPSGGADTVTYTYDKAGHQTGQKDNDGNVWTSAYDLLGRRISQTDPDTGTSTSAYDNAGNLLTTTDARGRRITYTYDELDRKTAVYDTTGGASPSASDELASWTYDTLKKGLPTSSTAYDKGSAYTQKLMGYDSHGWPQSTETIIPASEGALQGTYITDRTYTPTGNLHSYTDSAAGALPQETVSYGYDTFGRPTSVGGDVGSWDYVDKLAWTEYNEPQQFTFGPSGNFAQTTYSYDEQTRRLTNALTVTGSGRVKADSESYTYQPAGNVTRISDEQETGQTDTQCFRYDYAQRLSAAWTGTDNCAATPSAGSASTVGGPAPYWQSWTYDTTGDRKTQTDHDLTGDASKDSVATYTDAKATGGPAHALAQVDTHAPAATVQDTTTAYTYDKAGDIATRTTGAGTDSFTFNAEGKLAELDRTGQADPTTYVYDGDGNLLLRRDTGGSTLFLGDEEVSLKSGDTTPSGVRYISLAGTTVALHSSDGTFSYLLSDRQGTGRIEIGAATQALTRRQYLPFGGTRTAAVGWIGDRGYVGGQQDDSTGLTNLGAREYDASTGRFLTPDPLLVPAAPQSWNAYAYADNDPVTSSDPSGACMADVCGFGTPKGDGSGDIITTAPVDPGNASAGSCYDNVCTGSKPTPSATTRKAQDKALDAALNVGAKAEQARAAKAAKEGLTNRLIDLMGSLIGYDDVKSCLTKGDVMGCINTAVFDLPWTKLLESEKIATTLGKAVKVWRDLKKAETAVKDTEEAYKAADDAYKAAERRAEQAEASDAARRCLASAHSFLGSTPVRLASGATIPISHLKAGDTVLATDPQTGLTRPEKVQRLIVTRTDEDFTDLTITSSHQPDAPPQKLTTTWHHPFWDATHHRWTDAHNLTPGTHLADPDGTAVIVTAVRNYHGQAVTYDLTVADLHTYYVMAGSLPILVHNNDGCATPPLTRGQKVAAAPGVDRLNPAQLANLKRFMKGAPSTAEIPVIAQRSDGLVDFSYRVPGRVPGSYAIYRKLVDASGETVWAGKWTVTPDGSFAHIKEK